MFRQAKSADLQLCRKAALAGVLASLAGRDGSFWATWCGDPDCFRGRWWWLASSMVRWPFWRVSACCWGPGTQPRDFPFIHSARGDLGVLAQCLAPRQRLPALADPHRPAGSPGPGAL